MRKRVTLLLDDDLVKKIHEIQAKQIKSSAKSVSFSEIFNQLVQKGLKK